jgi:hypothetical protein
LNVNELVFISAQKGSFLKDAASQGIALLFPDTSPRGANIEGEDDTWDFGTGELTIVVVGGSIFIDVNSTGAGFYLNATKPKFAHHYNMLTHVTIELPQVIQAAGLPIVNRCSFMLSILLNRRTRISADSLFLDIAWEGKRPPHLKL